MLLIKYKACTQTGFYVKTPAPKYSYYSYLFVYAISLTLISVSICIPSSQITFFFSLSHTGNMADGRHCNTKLNETCYVSFNVSMRKDVIYLKNTPECHYKEAPPPPILAIVLGIIGGIVLIGLLLLLVWKLLVTFHDQAEYRNFMKDVGNRAKGDENPLYKDPATKFNNPVYVGATQD